MGICSSNQSGSGGDSTQTTKLEMDPDIKAAMQDTYQYAIDATTGEPTTYTAEERFAGRTQAETDAMTQLAKYARQGADPNLTGAVTGVGDIAKQDFGTGIAGYFNLYQQQVIDQTSKDIDTAQQQQALQDQSAISKGGGFGLANERRAIVDAERAKNFGDIKARTLGGLRQQGYQQAAQNMLANQQQQLGAYGQQVGLSNMARQHASLYQEKHRLRRRPIKSDIEKSKIWRSIRKVVCCDSLERITSASFSRRWVRGKLPSLPKRRRS